MPIPERLLDELNDRLNIVEVVSAYVPLTKKGANYWGLCPFHHEKTPSFSVNAEKQIFHCFGCGKGGGAIRFLMEMENLSFPDAVRKLAGQEGMEVPEDDPSGGRRRERRARILELNKEAARFYRTMLSDPRGAAVAAYIAEARRISPKYSARFGLGAAPEGWDNLIRAMADKGYDKAELLEAGLAVSGKNGGIYDKFRNRLMLPVIDVRGDVIGFTSRVMDDSAPKYLNTPETSVFKKRSVLYGVNYAKSSKRPNFILVEGNIDVISMHQAGFDNTVATMGTALTEEHIRLISRYTKELVLCLDNDAAGEDATQRALALLRGSNLEVKVLRLPQKRGEDGTLGKQDPDDYIKRYGGQAFEALMNRSENSVEYRLGQVQGKYDLEKDDQRSAYLQEAAGLIAGLSSPVEREIYGGRAADAARISHEVMAQEVERQRRQKSWQARRKQERHDLAPARQLQPKERALRYSNLHSARAEEGILRVVLLDGAYFRQLDSLGEEHFSSPVLGKAFCLLRQRWREDRPATLAALEATGEFSPQEMDLLSGIVQQPQPRHTAQAALEDNLAIVLEEAGKRTIASGADLADLSARLKQTKGYMEDD